MIDIVDFAPSFHCLRHARHNVFVDPRLLKPRRLCLYEQIFYARLDRPIKNLNMHIFRKNFTLFLSGCIVRANFLNAFRIVFVSALIGTLSNS